jgi:restriction endonuclease S subunit
MKTIKDLKDIAEVIPGYYFRTALQSKNNASFFALQAKNIIGNEIINDNSLDRVDFRNHRSRAIIRQNDVVISSRGIFRVGLVGIVNKNIIATSSVFILRLKNKDVKSEYLLLYLNSPEGQKQLFESSVGATIRSIKIRDLENIKIIVPNLEKQEKIVEVHYTNNKLQRALSKKIELINNINEVAINKLLKN